MAIRITDSPKPGYERISSDMVGRTLPNLGPGTVGAQCMTQAQAAMRGQESLVVVSQPAVFDPTRLGYGSGIAAAGRRLFRPAGSYGTATVGFTTAAFGPGKFYFEFTTNQSLGVGGVDLWILAGHEPGNSNGNNAPAAAIYLYNSPVPTAIPDYNPGGGSFPDLTGVFAATAGSVYGVGLDLKALGSSLAYYKNGVKYSEALADLSAPPGLPYYLGVSAGNGNMPFDATFNFGQDPFAYSIPSGFTAGLLG